MKKNFLKIAALLIAAMLLVVSCSQEVAPKNEDNGLVDAKLNIAYGRGLTVTGDQDAENFILEYTTEYQWTNGTEQNGYTEGVVGAKTATLSNDGKLGWLTPGYWKVTVNAYEADSAGKKIEGSEAIFSGSTSAYFTSKTSTATIFLEPVKASNNSIEFDFFMQDLGTYGTDFVVKYSIYRNGEQIGSTTTFNKTDDNKNEVIPVNDEKGHQSEYKKTVSVPYSGYYTVTVAVYEKDGVTETLKGGITKGMLLAGNQATVGGHIEPADYVGSSVNAYFIDVDTTLVASVGTASNNQVTVTYTLTDNTNIAKYNTSISNITRTFIWNFDGASTNPAQVSNSNFDTKVFEETEPYSFPGVKNASCTTIYSYKVSENEKYFWAETKSVQAKVPTTGFTY